MTKPLTTEQKRELVELLEEKARRKRYRLINDLFPEKGRYRRDLYPRHMEFFRAGATHRERLFMAANRCVTPWTFIETPTGLVPSAEAFSGFGGDVLAWDGEFECAAPVTDGYLKGIEPAFRLVTGSGRVFDCSRRHRVLTPEGWISVDQLASRASGLRWSQTPEDYQASCVAGGYLHDRPPQSALGIDPARLRIQDDARQLCRLTLDIEDAAARISQYTRAYPEHDLQTIRGDLTQLSGLFSMFAAPALSSDGLPHFELHQESRRLAIESYLETQSALGDGRHQLPVGASGLLGYVYPGGADNPEVERDQNLDRQRSGTSALRPESVDLFAQSDGRLGIFYPWHPILMAGGESIEAIVPLGYQPIIDAHVPGCNSYKAAGVYHHNSGKSVAGGAEMTYHLTGQYPDWWQGKRFDHPIRALAAGDTSQTTRDIIQHKLLGGLYDTPEFGTGLIPRDLLGKPTPSRGIANAYEEITVDHVGGGTSRLAMRSYDQGRRIFQGVEQHVVWLDEEVPRDVYEEALVRTMTTQGVVFMTFTPLQGLTPLVVDFLETRSEQEPV